MKIRSVVGSLAREGSVATGVGLFADGGELAGDAAALDAASGGSLREALARGDFTGKEGEELVLYLPKSAPARRLLVVGLGKRRDFKLDGVRVASARLASAARRLKLKKLTIGITGAAQLSGSIEDAAQAAVEGVVLGSYRFRELKSKASSNAAADLAVTLAWGDKESARDFRRGVKAGEKIAAAVCQARDLISRPSNVVTPSVLAGAAREVASAYGMRCTVLRRAELLKLGFGALLGVAQGSAEPPTFTILEYRGLASRPGAADAPPVVVIGKGVTFDSGGISIKSASGMERMKYDMSGAAATLGIMRAVADLETPLNVVGLIPATENLPSGASYKPGDILRSLSGTTIEVVNTDAEGRLILADALTYAQRFKPAAVIDLATLTGACNIAVGPFAIAMMGTNRSLLQRFEEAAEATAERVWQLPMWDDYFDLIKSDVADIKNSGGAPAGTITASLFLRQFVGDYPWVHLDIASTAWVQKARSYRPKGPTGIGVRLVTQMLRSWAADPEHTLREVQAACV